MCLFSFKQKGQNSNSSFIFSLSMPSDQQSTPARWCLWLGRFCHNHHTWKVIEPNYSSPRREPQFNSLYGFILLTKLIFLAPWTYIRGYLLKAVLYNKVRTCLRRSAKGRVFELECHELPVALEWWGWCRTDHGAGRYWGRPGHGACLCWYSVKRRSHREYDLKMYMNIKNFQITNLI